MSDCALVSTRKIENGEVGYSILRGAPRGLARPLATIYTPPLQPYASMLPAWSCPHCSQPLPANIIDTPSYVLGVIGARAAGKSHYISTLLQTLLRERHLDALGISEVIAATSKIAQHYEDEYYQPFFTDRGQLIPTTELRVMNSNLPPQPLIYTITFTPEAGFTPNRLNLVIFDYAGEDFTNEQSLSQNIPFLPHTDGLILLIDPLMMENAKGRLPLHIQHEFAAGAPASVVLENLIRALRRSGPSDPDGRINIPLVLTIAKADLLRYVLPHLGRHPLRENADYQAGFDRRAFAERGAQIRTLCQELDSSRIVDLARAFKVHAYSTVSATGRAPDRAGGFGRPEQPLQPQRCLDPLLWLLDQRRKVSAP